MYMARSAIFSVLECTNGDGIGFGTRSGPRCGFECGMGNIYVVEYVLDSHLY
jgi:hypothetical protein